MEKEDFEEAFYDYKSILEYLEEYKMQIESLEPVLKSLWEKGRLEPLGGLRQYFHAVGYAIEDCFEEMGV